MKALLEKALAALRWGWDRIAPALSWVANRVTAAFNTVYDPPPKTIRFWFWSWAALMFVAWLTFAFTNSWFYKPTVAYFSSFVGEDVSYVLPEPTPLPSVPTPAVTVPSVEVVCHDMSDTPQCEPVTSDMGNPIAEQVQVVPPPVAKPPVGYKPKKSPTGYKRRKHQPYVTYWEQRNAP